MSAIFWREIKSYFVTPVGWVFMGLFLAVAGLFFAVGNLFTQSSDLKSFLASIQFVYLFCIPVLTMRLFSEERRLKTDQLLLTSPVSIPAVVGGKFLAAFAVYGMTVLVTIINVVVVALFGDLALWETVASYLGFLLLGGCYIAIGVFISASTENQVTAALLSFFTLLFLWLIDFVSQSLPGEPEAGAVFAVLVALSLGGFLFLNTRNWLIAAIVAAVGVLGVLVPFIVAKDLFAGFIPGLFGWLSLGRRYETFAGGLLRLDAVFYYLSFASLFLYLTVRLIDKRRWS